MSDAKSKVVFRRVRGKIVPIRIATGAAAATVGAYAVSRSIQKESNKPNKALQAVAIGANLASAFVSAFPFRGKAGFISSQIGSLGIDAIGTSLNAASVAKMRGTRKEKLKAFAKAEARSQAIGYAAWGTALLSNKTVRMKTAEFLKNAVSKIGKFGVRAAV